MNAPKYAGILYIIITFMSSATSAELSKKSPPTAVEFIKILLKNGAHIKKGCDTGNNKETLQDKLVELISPDSVANQVIVTYNCIDDGRETGDARKVVPVWNCRITGRGIEKNGSESENNSDVEVYSTSITAYLDQKNLKIIDLLCL